MDLQIDDLIDITIRGARVMYTTLDHSEGASRLTTVLHGGTRYVLLAEPGAVKIVKPEVDAPEEATTAGAETRVSDERIEEILKGLSGFVGCCEIAHLDAAIDWAMKQPEVMSCGGPDNNGAEVELVDGTVFEFGAGKRWFVTTKEAAQ